MSHELDNQHTLETKVEPGSELVPAIMRVMRVVQYRKNVIFGTVCLFILMGAAYYVLATRIYESTAKLLIIQQKQDHLSTVGDNDSSVNTMATHRELVKSSIVLQQAIRQLAPEHCVDLQGIAQHNWVKTIAKQLSAKTTRKTNFIEVGYRSQSPEAATAIVNGVIQSYLQFIEKTHKGTAGDVINTLTHERDQLHLSLLNKQSALQQFRQKVGHIAISSDNGIIEPIIQRAVHFNDALMAAQEKRLNLQSSLASIQTAIARGEDINQYLAGIEAAVGRQMLLASLGLSPQDMQLVGEQEKQLLKYQSELSSTSTYFGPNHPRIVELKSQVQTIEQFLQNYRANVGQRFNAMNNTEIGPIIQGMMEQAVRQAKQKEQQMMASFEEARREASLHSGDLVQLQMLEREVQRLESLHDLLFEKIAAVDILQVQAPIQATIVHEPVPNSKPVSPQLRLVVLFCLVGGMACGGVIVYVQDILDDRFSSPEDMSVQLGVPVLAVVRELEPIPGEGLDSVHIKAKPNSAETEAFRTLRTALVLSEESADRVLVSSSEPSDGKTTVATNLAVAFAQAGKKTLMIDADLRKPGMSKLLGLKGQQGVADILSADLSANESAPTLVLSTDVVGLDVLPVGLRRSNPAELLSSANFAELLAWADSQYDQVLVDCPPVMAVSDAQIVGQLVDGALLVVRPEKNHRRVVMRAVESFHATGCRVLGIVANGVSENTGSYGYGYGYGYGHEDDDANEQEMDVVSGERNKNPVENYGAIPERIDTAIPSSAEDIGMPALSTASTGPEKILPRRVA